VGSHPELAKEGAFSASQIYSLEDVKTLVRLGELNGVQIIAEVETPSHARSWRLASQWANKSLTIKCNCTGVYGCYR
jgi:hypothetical protein